MDITNVLMLLGGLALFLHGMTMMGSNLEAAAGKRLKGILAKLTTNPLMGALAGLVLTCAIQSSSATTVMVVGFVNSGLMTLTQAVGVIMGANIGTTITGQMIALDVGALAPAFAFAGVAIAMFGKKHTLVSLGNVLAGFGILFLGMNMMSDAMVPLRTMPAFINLLSSFSNPLLGLLVGALFTALIQSSSASIGILQALALSGVLGLDNAVYVLFGMNIGTCITALLASLGTGVNARRAAFVHIIFNVFGALLFTALCMLLPITKWVEAITPGNAVSQIANMHTIFNIVTTLLLFPFGKKLAALSTRLLPERVHEEPVHLRFLNKQSVGAVSICLADMGKEVSTMLGLAKTNVEYALTGVLERTEKNREAFDKNEDILDGLNLEIARFMPKTAHMDMPTEDAKKLNALFRVTGDIERIGDHAENIFEYLDRMEEREIHLSEAAQSELRIIREHLLEGLQILSTADFGADDAPLQRIDVIEQEMDELTNTYRQNQVQRMSQKSWTAEGGVLYSEMMTDVERISDHLLNVAQSFRSSKISLQEE